MKAMLSQPMAGKTDAEIIATREKAINALKEKGYDVISVGKIRDIAKKKWKNAESCRFLYAFLQNPWRI